MFNLNLNKPGFIDIDTAPTAELIAALESRGWDLGEWWPDVPRANIQAECWDIVLKHF